MAWNINENAPALSGSALTLYGQVMAMHSFPSFANVQVYLPMAGTHSWQGEVAQTFLGTTPQPGALVLLGSALIGLAGTLRRKLRG